MACLFFCIYAPVIFSLVQQKVTVIMAGGMPWMAVAGRNRANMIRYAEVYWGNNIFSVCFSLKNILGEVIEVLLCFLEKL